MMTLYTIGFTKKSAEQFFGLLRNNHVKQLVDVRISNGSQLAGFAKGRQTETATLQDNWFAEYEQELSRLMAQREDSDTARPKGTAACSLASFVFSLPLFTTIR